ncbi:hypothetical protein WJX82_000312 [Trebouxia sp. C0006]
MSPRFCFLRFRKLAAHY